MKTSAPTICSTACSPLTARLSITMSLYGRRPRVVLSFVICTSLITTPSSETTSLPMLQTSSLLSCEAPGGPRTRVTRLSAETATRSAPHSPGP